MSRRDTCIRLMTIVGAILLSMPCGINNYWGNLATYVLSYLHYKDASVDGTDASWLISIFLAVRLSTLIASSFVIRRFGKLYTCLVGVLLFNVGLLSSYFAVQHSILVLNFTFGGLCGIGVGILNGPSLEYAVECGGQNRGLFLSLVQSSSNVGAVFVNEFLTVHMNPNNKIPDLSYDSHVFFSQTDILKCVPSTFFYMTVMSCVVQFIGILLLTQQNAIDRKDNEESRINEDTTFNENGRVNSRCDSEMELEKDTLNETFWHLFKKPTFYLMWFTNFLGAQTVLLMANYYKIFGQLTIQDDHFLALIGTVTIISVVVFKILFGYITDVVSFKHALMGSYFTTTLFCSFLYLSPFVSRWLYLVIATIVNGNGSISMVAYAVGMTKLFGKRHVAAQTGLVSTSIVAISLVGPPWMEAMLAVGGWQCLFVSTTVINLICVVLLAIFLPFV